MKQLALAGEISIKVGCVTKKRSPSEFKYLITRQINNHRNLPAGFELQVYVSFIAIIIIIIIFERGPGERILRTPSMCYCLHYIRENCTLPP